MNQPNEATPPADAAPPAADPAGTPPTTPVAPASDPPPADGAPDSLIPPNGAPLPPVPLTDQIPEKYRVMKDGVLDVEASASKLAAAHKSLETKLGNPSANVPATPADYSVKPAEGIGMSDEDMAQFVADPMTKGFLEKLHAAGASNDVVGVVLNSYLEFAPQLLAADSARTVEEAKADLSKLWADPETQQTNFRACARAIEGYATANEDLPGSAKRLHEKYGTDPDFIAFAANIGRDMQEDRQAAPQGLPTGEDIEALQKSEAYWKAEHPDHARVKAKVEAHYQRLHGTARA